jgi:hypothetical protein
VLDNSKLQLSNNLLYKRFTTQNPKQPHVIALLAFLFPYAQIQSKQPMPACWNHEYGAVRLFPEQPDVVRE